MISPEQITADSLYQRAVLRVYGPWLSSDVPPGLERRRALARVRHAWLVLAMRGTRLPQDPPAEARFNQMGTPMSNRKRPADRPMIIHGWDFGPGQLLSPGDVAVMFRVDPKTVARWAEDGRLASIRTLGGVRRFSRQQIEHLMYGGDAR